jgi:branched-chain amino acid transport system permease protein
MVEPPRSWLQPTVTVLVLAALALVPAFSAWTDTGFYTTLFTRILVYALAAIGLNVVLGYGGLVSFGHALYLALGAYTYGILSSYGIYDGWLHLAVALGCGTIAAALIGAVCLRTSGMAFIMITLAFAQMSYFVAVSLKGFGGDEGLSLPHRSRLWPFDLTNDTTLYYVVFACLLLALIFVHRFAAARFGLLIRAGRTNPDRLATLGFPLLRYRLASYVISALICVIAGVFLANLTRFVSPSMMHWSVSGDLIVAVVLGGQGTVLGPVLGAVALGLIEQMLPSLGSYLGIGLGTFLQSYWKLFLGLFIVAVTLGLRRGLYGLLPTTRSLAR